MRTRELDAAFDMRKFTGVGEERVIREVLVKVLKLDNEVRFLHLHVRCLSEEQQRGLGKAADKLFYTKSGEKIP